MTIKTYLIRSTGTVYNLKELEKQFPSKKCGCKRESFQNYFNLRT